MSAKPMLTEHSDQTGDWLQKIAGFVSAGIGGWMARTFHYRARDSRHAHAEELADRRRREMEQQAILETIRDHVILRVDHVFDTSPRIESLDTRLEKLEYGQQELIRELRLLRKRP